MIGVFHLLGSFAIDASSLCASFAIGSLPSVGSFALGCFPFLVLLRLVTFRVSFFSAFWFFCD